jgi:hypothetical protein
MDDFNCPGFDTAPRLDPADQLVIIDPSLLMCQCPCTDTEIDNWDASAFLQSSSLAKFSLSNLSFPISADGHETSTTSAATSDSPKYSITHPSAPTAPLGEGSDNLCGLNLDTGCTLPDMSGVFNTQRDEQYSIQQPASKHSETINTHNAEHHSTVNETKALTVEQEAFNCLSSEDKYIVTCRLKRLTWKLIVEGYTQNWGYKSEAALGMKLNRLRKRNPIIDQMLCKPKETRGY